MDGLIELALDLRSASPYNKTMEFTTDRNEEWLMKHFMTGDEAIARGIYEADVKICSAYPGTPSTEIFENLAGYKDEGIYCEWAPNEKVAAEVAWGASVSGVRSVCAMKHVGVNVAADPIFTATYNGTSGGMMIVSADDPDMHSSQNEQDNRYYAKFAKMPLLEPADSQEAKDFAKAALQMSEDWKIPVMLRITTRIAHSKSLVEFGERESVAAIPYEKDISRFTCTPRFARQHHIDLEKKLLDLAEYNETSPFNSVEMKGSKVGVISASVAYQYAKEVFPADTSFLKLGMTYPLPMKLIQDFAAKVETLYVIEELEPFMEEQIKAAGIDCIGKEKVSRLFELNPELLAESLFGEKATVTEVSVKAAPRPPALCAGCPHRGFFYTLTQKKANVVTSDIGCYALGDGDTALCMGGGFTVGMGMSKGFAAQGDTDHKVFGIMGDSTFFHSGITGAVEIIYNKGNMIPVVLDNSITAMTGHQDNPSTGHTLQGEVATKISIEKVLEAIGFKNVIVVDPQDLTAMQKAVDDALESSVPAAIVTRRPCILIKGLKLEKALCEVDRDKCKSCKKCLKVECPAIEMTKEAGDEKAKSHIDPTLCIGCTVCMQVCPFEAISKV